MTLARLSVLRQTIALILILVCGGPMAAQSRTPAPEPSTQMTRRQPVPPLSRQITIRLDSVSVQDAIDVIAKEARLQVSYKPDALPQGRRISLRLNEVTAKDALAQVLKAYDFDIRTVDDSNFVVVKRGREQKSSANDVQQDSGRVRGRVVDSTTGKGIAGVTVKVDETQLSTQTSGSGEYTILNVPTGVYRVVARVIGYRVASQTVTVVEDRTVTANFVLSARSVVLSEVITSITGEQRKIEIGNDVTTIKVDSVLRTAPITTVTDLLEGRVPGLTVLRSSGVPGAPSRLRLRGLGGGLLPNEPGAPTNDPIVIVDGIRIDAAQSGKGDQSLLEGSGLRIAGSEPAQVHERASAIDQIDPNSIDKIDVYKGPSATALYGSDAANGVIVITTKRGMAGPVRWSMSGYQSVEYLAGSYAAPGYYPFCYGGNVPCDWLQFPGMAILLDSVVRFQALDEPRLSPFGRGNETGGSATVSGGTGMLMYSITGSTRSSLGLLKVPDFYRNLFRQALDSSPPNWMRRPNTYSSQGLDVNVSAEWHKNLRATLSTRVTGSNQWQSATQDRISDLSGQYIDTISPDVTKLGGYITRNNAKQLTTNLALNLDWTRWHLFPLKATAGINRINQDEITRIPRGVPVESNPNTVGGYATGTGVSTIRTGQLNGMLFPGRRVSVTAGTQVIKSEQRRLQGRADSLPLGVATPSRLSAASQNHTSNMSGGWYLEPRINLNSRFFINPGFRLDGGNASGKNSGFRGGLFSLFPKLNQSWLVINRDDGNPMFGVITSLRTRMAFGIAGVQPQAIWQYRMTVPPKDRMLDMNGLDISTLGNTRLHPERTRELEGGFDLDLWNGRTMLTVTQYRKVRIDAIVPFPVAPSVYGVSMIIYNNIGRVQNTGTELTASVIPIDNRIITWSLSASLSKHSNKLISLNDGLSAINVGNGTRLVPGYPLFGRWEVPILGYSTGIGDRLSIKDVIIGDSAIYMGAQIPNFDLPIHTQLSLFQGLVSVNASFSYSDGLTQLNAGNGQLLANLYLNPQATLADQAAALMAKSICTGFKCTDYGLIQTVNSLRFQSFSLGYNVPRQLAKKIGASSLSFAIQGSNLGLWTNYRGKDPNVSSTFSDIVIDSGQLPEPRTWRVQCRVGN